MNRDWNVRSEPVAKDAGKKLDETAGLADQGARGAKGLGLPAQFCFGPRQRLRPASPWLQETSCIRKKTHQIELRKQIDDRILILRGQLGIYFLPAIDEVASDSKFDSFGGTG